MNKKPDVITIEEIHNNCFRILRIVINYFFFQQKRIALLTYLGMFIAVQIAYDKTTI